MDATEIEALLHLVAHPEGGAYAETWRAPAGSGERSAGSAIYFLLRAGQVSRWHRVDGAEAWHFYAGAPLELRVSSAGPGSGNGEPARRYALGSDLAAGQRPQAIVPAGAWQSARSLGSWTLVGCTVVPAFEFAGFELAPEGWQPA